MYGTMDTGSKVAIGLVVALIAVGIFAGVRWLGRLASKDSPGDE
jgi:hypothetical protein